MRINTAYPPRVAALFIFGTAIAATTGCSSHAEIAEPSRSAVVAQATPATAAVAEVYSGDVHARFESQLGFRIGGKIKARLVDVGAQVIAGQVLAELDPQDVQLQVASARATLASAEADAALAKSERDRYHSLLEKHFVSQTDFDAKDNVLKATAARVTEVRSALSINQNQAGYASLRADHAGAITTINAEVGQVVAAGQTIATLAHDGEIEAEISVPENRIGKYNRKGPSEQQASYYYSQPQLATRGTLQLTCRAYRTRSSAYDGTGTTTTMHCERRERVLSRSVSGTGRLPTRSKRRSGPRRAPCTTWRVTLTRA